MVKKLSGREKELIKLNHSLIKQKHTLGTRIFFTIATAIAGLIGLYVKYAMETPVNPRINNIFIGGIFFAISLFLFQFIINKSDLKNDFNKLCETIIKEESLEKYKISKTSHWIKSADGLQTGLFIFIAVFIWTEHLLLSVFIGLFFASAIIFGRRNY